MKPTKIFTEFSAVAVPCVIAAFVAYLIVDSRPRCHSPADYRNCQQRFSLMLTSDGQLAVELYSGFGFDAETYECVMGKTLGATDRH